jgi:hypothetical protein
MQKLDGSTAETQRTTAKNIIQKAQEYRSRYAAASSDTSKKEEDIQKLLDLQKEKLVIPRLVSLVHDSLPPVNPPELANVRSGEELKQLIESDPKKYARVERGQLLIESMEIDYVANITDESLSPKSESYGGGGQPPGSLMHGPRGPGARMYTRGGPPGGTARRQPAAKSKQSDGTGEAGFVVQVSGRLLYGTSRSAAIRWLQGEYFNNLRANGQTSGLGFFIPDDDPEKRVSNIGEPIIRYYHDRQARAGKPGTAAADEIRDPVTGEDETNDWRVEFSFRVQLGEKPEAPKAEK